MKAGSGGEGRGRGSYDAARERQGENDKKQRGEIIGRWRDGGKQGWGGKVTGEETEGGRRDSDVGQAC